MPPTGGRPTGPFGPGAATHPAKDANPKPPTRPRRGRWPVHARRGDDRGAPESCRHERTKCGPGRRQCVHAAGLEPRPRGIQRVGASSCPNHIHGNLPQCTMKQRKDLSTWHQWGIMRNLPQSFRSLGQSEGSTLGARSGLGQVRWMNLPQRKSLRRNMVHWGKFAAYVCNRTCPRPAPGRSGRTPAHDWWRPCRLPAPGFRSPPLFLGIIPQVAR
jgi:hypothetical protein